MTQAVDIGTIQTLIRLEVPDQVPLTGSIPYDALVKKLKTPVDPELLQRLIRFTRLVGFLDEDAEGAVKHSPMSAIFVNDPDTAGQARFMADFGIRPCSFIYESIKLDPSGEAARQGPLALMAREPGAREGPTFFEVLEKDPVNRKRWHDGMAVHNDSMVRHVAGAYDWGTVQSLVDVSYEGRYSRQGSCCTPTTVLLFLLTCLSDRRIRRARRRSHCQCLSSHPNHRPRPARNHREGSSTGRSTPKHYLRGA